MADPRTAPIYVTANGMAVTGSTLLHGLVWSHISNVAGGSLGIYDVNTAHATSLKITARKMAIFSTTPTGSTNIVLSLPTLFVSGIYVSMTSRSAMTLFCQRKK